MGEIAEWSEDKALEQETLFNHKLDKRQIKKLQDNYNKGGLKWTMRSGKKILVKKMTDEHIQNSTDMLKRNPYQTERIKKWIEIFKFELTFRNIL